MPIDVTDELLMPTMRFRWVDTATNNDRYDDPSRVMNALQQFWVHETGSTTPGKWVDIPHAGHVTAAPRNTLQ